MARDDWLMGSVAAQDTYNPEEGAFQAGIRATPWYGEFVARYGEAPDLNTPDYNYRAAWAAGARPDVRDPGDQLLHWDSRFKGENHPNRYVGGVDTRTGQRMGDVLAVEPAPVVAETAQPMGALAAQDQYGLDMKPTAAPQPAWVGTSEDKQRAMNLLRMKATGQPLAPEASDWLDQYMIWVDRNLPPVGKKK